MTGLSGAAPILSAWFANNSEPHYRRATSIALNLIFSTPVCFVVTYIISSTHFPVFLGQHSEYLELPKQGRTKIQENNDYKPCHVSLLTRFLLFYLRYIVFLCFFFCFGLSRSILLVAGALINTTYLSWRNKLKKRPEVRAKLLEKYIINKEDDDGGLSAWTELGDQHPDFVYTTWSLSKIFMIFYSTYIGYGRICTVKSLISWDVYLFLFFFESIWKKKKKTFILN